MYLYILSYYWQETRWRQQPSPPQKNKGNGQKREYRVLFWPKTNVPENNSGRECCWPYLIGQHSLSPVFGQKRPCTPGNSYFAQLSPVFGHFVFLSGGLLDCLNRSTVRWRGEWQHFLTFLYKQFFCIPLHLVPSPSETWFQGMSVGGSFRRV